VPATNFIQRDPANGDPATRLYRLIAETQLSPFVSFVNNVQFDSQTSVLGWQSRFRWTVRPGNDLYLVYIHNLAGRSAQQADLHPRPPSRIESDLHPPILTGISHQSTCPFGVA